MSGLDVIPVPGYPGMYNRRVVVQMWQAAGSPRIVASGGGRLYGEQKRLYDNYRNRVPGYNPADNPDNEKLPLAHVRMVAWDLANPTDAVRSRMRAAGFVFPYSNERWHAHVPNVFDYPIVRSIPALSGGGASPLPLTPTPEDDDMPLYIWTKERPTVFGIGYALIDPAYKDGVIVTADQAKATEFSWSVGGKAPVEKTRAEFNAICAAATALWRANAAAARTS